MNSTPTPTPTSFDPTATAANVALSSFWLAIILVVASIVLVVLVLAFAYFYHAKALDILKLAVRRGATPSATNEPAIDSRFAGTDPKLNGPGEGALSAELLFWMTDVPDGAGIAWEAVGGEPDTGDEQVFSTKFTKAGNYIVVAKITPAAEDGKQAEVSEFRKVVSIGAASAPSSVAVPFVLKNWGRLVVILFGVGVVGALMATKVLVAEAGVGILGVLLGVGATSAGAGGSSSGGTGEKAKKGDDDDG